MIFQMTEPERTEERERASQFMTRLLPARTQRVEMNRLDFVVPLFLLVAVLNMNQTDGVCKAVKMVRYRVYIHICLVTPGSTETFLDIFWIFLVHW